MAARQYFEPLSQGKLDKYGKF
jgi:hypothetical protein